MAAHQPDRRRDAGALILSYVIVIPVFMLAVMVMVQASLWYLARQAALAAARQGADAARADNAQPDAGREAALRFARTAASAYLRNPAAVVSLTAGQTIQVKVSGSVPSLVPGVVIDVSQVVQAPVEQFTTP